MARTATIYTATIDLADRRISMSLSVTGGELFLALGDESWTLPLLEHRLGS